MIKSLYIPFKVSACVILISLLSGCLQRNTKPEAELDSPPLALDWETLVSAYPVPLPLPILNTLRKKAKAAYQAADYPSTHILLDQMFRLDSRRPDVMALKGWVYCQQAEYTEAQLWISRARDFLDQEDSFDPVLAEIEKGCQ